MSNKKKLNLDSKYKLLKEIKIYLSQLPKVSKLSKERERELTLRMYKGDELARQKLIESCLKLVVSIAIGYTSYTVLPFVDLIEEGNLGLIVAVDKFNINKGCRLPSWSQFWIRSYMIKAINRQSYLIRLSDRTINILNYLIKYDNSYSIGDLDNINFKRAAEALKIKEKVIRDAIKYTIKPIITNEINEIENQEDSNTIMSRLKNKNIKVSINELLQPLTGQEKLIIIQKYGLREISSHTYGEIGIIHNLSRERIRQIHDNALIKIRNNVKDTKLEKQLLELLR